MFHLPRCSVGGWRAVDQRYTHKLRGLIRNGILKIRRLPVIFLTLLASVGTARAQDLEPRAYANLPVGQQFFAAGYAYSEGELNPAPGVPIEDAEIEVDTFVAAYLRTLDLWGKAGRVGVIVPRTCFKGDAFLNGEFVEGDRCGAADPIINLTYLFYGAPALSLEEFRRTPQRRVIGAGLRVRAPLGDYNNENLINHSANRWEFRPELGISNRWGRWGADAAISAVFFTRNDRFAGRTELEQDPLYQVQAHVIYFLSKGRWLSINGNYFWGGRTERDGVRQDDRQDNSRAGVTLGWPLNTHNTLRFYASRGVSTRIGNDFDTFGMLYQYRW